MALTPSEVASLTRSLSRWEIAEYLASGLVTLACAGEYIANFKSWFTDGDKDKKERLSKRSTLLLIASLSFELICLYKTNEISGRVLGSLDEKADAASKKSEQAVLNADSAITKAGDAKTSAIQAEIISGNAKTVAAGAESLARGARKEADSFEKDIALAKRQASEAATEAGKAKSLAAEAATLAAEAHRETAEATAEVNRLKSPRSLTNIHLIISELKAFKSTEYTFSGVWPDIDSIKLLRSVDSVLQAAEWRRVIPPDNRGPAIKGLLANNPLFSVPTALTDGIIISVDSPEDLSVLKSLPTDKRPLLVRAAMALYFAISPNISPPEEHPNVIDVHKGESKTVRISIGKKP